MKTFSHPRDNKLNFNEKEHIYTLDKNNLTSVTTLVKSFFSEFNASLVVDKMMASKNWPSSKYYGRSKEDIIEEWENKGKEARELGTLMHKQIEDFFCKGEKPEKTSKEFEQFLNFWDNFTSCYGTFSHFASEWKIYSEKIAGTIDFALFDEEGKIFIIDWKRSREIKFTNSYSKGKKPFSFLDDCNYSHYSLQLNCYRAILEKYYNKEVLHMFLAVFHPERETYDFIEISRIEEVEDLI